MVCVGAAVLVGATMAVDKPNPNDPRFQSITGAMRFDLNRYRDFEDYVGQIRRHLETNKVYMNPAAATTELDVATPFELMPDKNCAIENPRRGILLIHGLSDMPFAMRDVGEAFAARCFLVRVILLPGHGTRAGDLLEVSYEDWIKATYYGISTLKQEVEEVYVGGFSLGGLLALQAVLSDSELDGVFAFSPALALDSHWTLMHTQWLRKFFEWADTDPQEDYARYEAMPINGLAETYALTQVLAQSLDLIEVPIFIAQSADDPVINPVKNEEYFRRYLVHPNSRLLIYRRGSEEPDATDPRIRYYNSYLPEQKVFAFSHQSVHIAPDNPHYGVTGDYRNCDSDDRSADALHECLTTVQPWRGEFYGSAMPPKEVADTYTRLTYNPRFDDLLDAIDIFLEAL